MLTHPTLNQLHQLGLLGMAKAFGDVETSGEAAALTHPEWLALLLDREMTYRHDKKLAARLRYARLRQQAAVEDVDYRAVQVMASRDDRYRSTRRERLRHDPPLLVIRPKPTAAPGVIACGSSLSFRHQH